MVNFGFLVRNVLVMQWLLNQTANISEDVNKVWIHMKHKKWPDIEERN